MNVMYSSKQIPVPVQFGGVHEGSPISFFTSNLMMQMTQNQKHFGNESEVYVNKKQATSENLSSLGFSSSSIPSSSYPALHIAAALGQSLTASGLLENPAECVDPNQVDHNGNTALMWACSEGNADIVQTLIDNNADLNMQNFAGETGLFLAAARGYAQICSALLENGADPNLSNQEGATPLHMAAAGGHLASILVLVRFGAFVNAQDEEGDSPLHYAVREGQLEALRFLVSQCRAWVDIKNEDLETPLELASCLQESSMIQFLAPLSSQQEGMLF